jgi:glutamyl-tRNA reductase
VEEVGKLHIRDEEKAGRLWAGKRVLGAEELMYLGTCNRVEFLISFHGELGQKKLQDLFTALYPSIEKNTIADILKNALVYEGAEALRHIFRVASSIDSLVVGEREIITQVRNAYEFCRSEGLTGDLLRLVVSKAIENAKEVYTQTDIARKPVSVVSLAYRRLRDLNVRLDARFIIVGAGITNTAMCRYLLKHGFKNFTVFNRTLAHAEKLAEELHGRAFSLDELKNFNEGFDVMVSCTGSPEAVITKDIYKQLTAGDTNRKVVIDLAVPNDVADEVMGSYDINLIAVNNLQQVAAGNLKERQKELETCERIITGNLEEFKKVLKERKVELAMSSVPKMVKEIRETAVNEVFAKDIEKLDENSKEVLDKVIAYLEKKYISGPMKMAKEILIEESSSK